jgi:hypothetical protein
MFDVRFLRARCPKLDVGGEAIGEFLRSGPLRFALAMGSGGQRAHRVRYVQPVRFLTSRQHQQGQDQSIYRLAHSPD